MIVVPLFVGPNCVGSLSFAESERVTSFAARDVDVALVVARQLTMALENIKTFEREQRITDRFRFLARVTEPLFSTLDQTKMLELLLHSITDGFADYGFGATLADDRFNWWPLPVPRPPYGPARQKKWWLFYASGVRSSAATPPRLARAES